MLDSNHRANCSERSNSTEQNPKCKNNLRLIAFYFHSIATSQIKCFILNHSFRYNQKTLPISDLIYLQLGFCLYSFLSAFSISLILGSQPVSQVCLELPFRMNILFLKTKANPHPKNLQQRMDKKVREDRNLFYTSVLCFQM